MAGITDTKELIITSPENYSSTDLVNWYRANNRFGINVLIQKASYKVLALLNENDSEISFVCVSPSVAPFLVRVLKQFTPLPGYEKVSLATRDIVEVQGFAQVSAIENLGELLLANPECNIELAGLAPFIKYVQIGESTLPIVEVLGSGAFGMALLLNAPFYTGETGSDGQDIVDSNLIVMKTNLNPGGIEDLRYDVAMQQLYEDRMGKAYVPQAQPGLYDVGLVLEQDQAPVYRGKAFSMTNVEGKVLSKCEHSRTNAEKVFNKFREWIALGKKQHKLGIVNPDCHAGNLLVVEDGLKSIDNGQLRAVKFNLQLALELMSDVNSFSLEQRLALTQKVLNALQSASHNYSLSNYARNMLSLLASSATSKGIKPENLAKGIQQYCKPEDLATALTHHIAGWIEIYDLGIDWDTVIKKQPDLWITPDSRPYISVFNTRTFNFAAAISAVEANDFSGIAALEQRAKLLELMNALKLPFYTTILDELNGIELFISGNEWNWSDPSSKARDIAANTLATVLKRVDQQNIPFVEKDLFVKDALENSLIASAGPVALAEIWEVLKTYLEEYDKVYTFRRMAREDMTYPDVTIVLERVITLATGKTDAVTQEAPTIEISGLNDDTAEV